MILASQFTRNPSNKVLDLIIKNGRLQPRYLDWRDLISSKHLKYIWDNFREEAIQHLTPLLTNPNQLAQNDEYLYWDLTANEYGIDVFEYYYENVMTPEEKNDPNLWEHINMNPNVLHILEKNQDKIYWLMLSENPDIFVRDSVK